MQYDLVILGNYTKDTVVSSAGTRLVDGGGFNYGAHVAAMMGLKTAAVTRLAKEDDRVVEALKKLGVDVFPTYTPQSTHMRLYYPTADVDNRVLTVTQTAGSFTVDQFKNLEAKAFLVNASTRGEVGLEVLKELKKRGKILSIDAQGYVRTIAPDTTLVFDTWPGKEEVLPGKFSHLLVHPGESVTFLTAGGGGYGDPAERDSAFVQRDVDLGYVSPARALANYPAAFKRGP